MKENSEIVLSALLGGQRLLINGHLYFINEDKVLGYVHEPSETCILEDELNGYPIDLSLTSFIKLCDNIDKKEIFVIASEHALAKMHYEKAAHKKRHRKDKIEEII